MEDAVANDLDGLARTADAHFASGSWEAAATTFEELVQARSSRPDLRFKLAQCYEELGRLQDAIDVLKHPSMAGLDKTSRRLAKFYIAAKDFAAAAPLVDALVATWPNDAKFAKWKAVCVAKGSNEDRIAERIVHAQALIAEDRVDEAERAYLDLLADHPESQRAYLHLGQIYADQRRWGDAIIQLRAGLAIDPRNPKIRSSLARALLKDGQPANVIALLDGTNDDVADIRDLALLQRAHAELRSWPRVDEIGSRLTSALDATDPAYSIAIELRQNAQLHTGFALADAIARTGNSERLISSYRELVGQHPDSALAWLKLHSALAAAGRDEEAAEALQKAARLHPSDLEVRKSLTHALVEAWPAEDLRRYFLEAEATGTADFESYRWLARDQADRGDWASSLASARKALVLDPDSPSAAMVAIRALVRLDRLPEALDALDPLLSRGVKLVEALQTKADILIQFGRVQDAISLYQGALAASPKHPLISYKLSRAMLMAGQIEGFHRFYEKRRELEGFRDNEALSNYQPWNGELSIEGKLLVWTDIDLTREQTIPHLVFLRHVQALGLDVVFEAEAGLVGLCQRSFPDVAVLATGSDLPAEITHHTPIGSLSRWFKPDLASFATMQAYLTPDPALTRANRTRLQQLAGAGQILVGVALAPSSTDEDPTESISLEKLCAQAAMAGVTLVNLNDGRRAGAGPMLASDFDQENVDGLASAVAAMDLIVCGPNLIAHLAGATGVPAHVLLPTAPMAEWAAQDDRSIFYSSIQLIRRSPIDADWNAVLSELGKTVGDFIANYSGERQPLAQPAGLTAAEISDAARAYFAQGAFTQSAYRTAFDLIDRVAVEERSRELQMLRGDLLARFGDWEAARATYIALRPEGAFDPDVEKAILSNSLAMYDLEFALPVARGLAAVQPGYRTTVGMILYHLRRNDEALTELRSALLDRPQSDELSNLVGTILLESGRAEQAEAFLTSQAAIARQTEAFTLLGRAISLQGRGDEALAYFDRSVALSEDDPDGNFWRTRERLALKRVSPVPLPPFEGRLPQVTEDDLVIFFVADADYFREHGLVLIESIGRSCSGAKCHVHVINPDPGVAEAIAIVRSILPGLSLTYSHETADFDGCSETHIRAYYASVRFVRLAELFGQAPASYLALDADCIVRGDLIAPISSIDADVGMRMRYDERPHATVAAGALLLRPTARAARFIAEVSNQIRSILESGEATWFLDQIVLSHVARTLGDRGVSIAQLDLSFVDWFFRDSSLVWTGKGPRKSANERYTSEISRYQNLQMNERVQELLLSSAADPANQRIGSVSPEEPA